MHIMWFTERQYHYDPETDPAKSHLLETQILRNRSFFGLPNKNFDAETGLELLNQYIDEKVYSEDLGFDGLMLNEHHGTPFCLGSVMDVEAAVLARATKRAKIVLLGNPVPTVANALRLAEELGDDRSHLEGTPGSRMGARRGQRAARQQRQSRAQSRILRGRRRLHHQGVDDAGPLPLRGQAFSFSLRESLGAAAAEAASADLDSRPRQPRHRYLVREEALPVHRARHAARADGGAVEHVHRSGRARGLSGRFGEFRLSATGIRCRQSGARRGVGQTLPLWRRVRAFRAPRVDVPSRLQFEGSNQATGAPRGRRELARQADHRCHRRGE